MPRKHKTVSEEPLTKQQYEALAEFRYRLRRFVRFSEELSRGHGLTPLQYLLLLQIKGFPGRDWASVGELAERLQSHHHGVVSLIDRCEQAGLVRRARNDDDRRRVQVRLTARGEQCLLRLASRHRAELVALRGSFNVPDLDVLRGD